MRKLITLAALCSALWAFPAAAMTASQAECPVQLTPKDLGARAVEQVLNEPVDASQKQSVIEAFTVVADACLKREKVTGAQAEPYVRYVIARIMHDDMVRSLTAQGVSTAMIDRVFGLGAGKLNPSPDQLTDEQFAALDQELTKTGRDIKKMPKSMVGLIGAYVGVTGEMHRSADLVG